MTDRCYQRPSTWQEMAARIEYADLRVDTRERDLRLLCLEAEKFRIPAVVVNPVNVSLTAALASHGGIQVAAVVSYPVGAYEPESKLLEIEDVIADGAEIIYMVMAVGAYLNGWVEDFTRPEIDRLVRAASGRPTRLVTEASVLSERQQRELSRMTVAAGVGELVVCTGFTPGKLPPVSDRNIQTIVDTIQGKIGVCYMGEIESSARAFDLLSLGVTRFCTPSARQILAVYPDFPGQA